ncbi:MAG: hypothetical protein ABIL58_14775 [Pseudomonadota bacterium]
MRKTLAILFCGLLMTAAVTATATGKSSENKGHGYRDPVVVDAIGFSAASNGGSVVMRWKKYLRSDLKYYKVVRSDTNPDPVYPEDGYVFFSTDAGKTVYEDNNVPTGTWYYRLCVITHGGDRWVSPVVVVTIKGDGSAVPGASDFK